jgi:putative ABC transport system substrate-binding protein
MPTMSSLRRLGPGIALIAGCCLFLLYADWSRRSAGPAPIPRVAVMQYSSTAILDEGVRGLLAYLHEQGYREGRNIVIDRYNAENDMPTAASMAKELTAGRYGYVFTVSTNCLQAVANANREGRVKHVFGVVADPLAAKVGINPRDPLDHPKNMTGIGSLIPVGELLETARRLNPGLKSVGLPWNPSQTNSEKYTELARETSRRLGIRLLEGSVDQSSAVGEVTAALAARGAEAILVTGDLTVQLGLDTLVGTAHQARIPVISTLPASVSNGVLLAIGADYYQIGRDMGELAVRVLRGADMSRMPILYIVPRAYAVNRGALAGLRGPWRFPPNFLSQAAKVL